MSTTKKTRRVDKERIEHKRSRDQIADGIENRSTNRVTGSILAASGGNEGVRKFGGSK